MPKPIDRIVDELARRVRTDPSGAKSLAHVMVIVPTAQSGRRLRLRLAERFGALLPPSVVLPAQLLVREDDAAVATRAEEIAALGEALGPEGSLAIAAQLADVRNILGAGALSFADVAERVGTILTGDLADVEIARWRKLAATEAAARAILESRGKVDRIAAMKASVADPPRFEGVEEVFVAYVLEMLPAARAALERLAARDGLAVTRLDPDETASADVPRRCVKPCATAAIESEKIAEIFAGVGADESLPALCVVDPSMVQEVEGALRAKGLKVHDPSYTRLATSSLGHLTAQIAALVRTRSYAVFSAFIRGGDVRRWLAAELNFKPEEMTGVLADLDRRQAELLPETIDDIAAKTRGKLRAVFEFVEAQLRKRGLRALLQMIFRGRALDTRDADDREFAAAAETLNALIDECFCETVPSAMAWELFERRLGEATYSLEPDEGDVILLDGWLELAYLEADEVVIAGFCEGCVPEAVVGHAFLPDALRRGLGLPDNESRTRRDRAMLALALSCRTAGSVSISFHTTDVTGDALKPSRLLFETDDTNELVERVKTYYSVGAGSAETPAPDLPNGWKLRLETPPEFKPLEHASPSSIDDYLKCPFTYYLKRTFGEREDDRAEELDPSEFGNLAHQALERWGRGPSADAEDAATIADELASHIDDLLGERFGTAVPAIVALQGESLKRRLRHFADAQVEWHRAGWRIRVTERKLEVMFGHTRLHGRCDRIDFNPETGRWCVIDYKTWDTPERKTESLQLPLYCSMLDACPDFPEAKRECISSVYCVIGKTAEFTGYGKSFDGDALPEAENRVRELIGRIERGIFWPPSPNDEWRWDFKPWFPNGPEAGVDGDWIADQKKRMEQ